MILRIVGGRIEPGRFEAVADSYRQHYEPVARRTIGLERYVLGVRADPEGGHRIAALTLWSNLEAALATYGGNLALARTLDGRSHGETMTDVDYYEIDEAAARRVAGPAGYLRVTAGTVARGLDADIQQELRRNVPDLPPEALEAYLGRRVRGTNVEIAFVSTWSAIPAGGSLSDPIWPEISTRYDTFRVELLEVVLTGSGVVQAP
jgi:hypothetical protein